MGSVSVSNENDPRWFFIKEEEAIVPPPGIIHHIKDNWWSYHPTKGLLFWKSRPRDRLSPQCNSSEVVCRHLNLQLHPWAEVKFVPSVFIRVNLHHYT